MSALAGGTAALTMQNWSCGYYLVFFAPFVPVFVIHQMWTAGRLREWRPWIALTGAAILVTLLTYPILTLYLEAQRVYGFRRPLSEVVSFSADVYSYFSAAGALHVWGEVMQAIRRPEGELFFGLVPMLLAVLAVLPRLKPIAQNPREGGPALHPGRGIRITIRLLAVILAVQIAALVMIVFTGGFITSIAGIPIRATNATRLFGNAVIAAILLLLLSARARQRLRDRARSPVGLAAILMVVAVWMSLGPVPSTGGQFLQVPPLYRVFYDHVPGFDGLRVPARYAMVAAVFLSVLAGAGAAVLLRQTRRIVLAGTVLATLFVAEASFAPMAVNVSWGGNHVQPPGRIEPAAAAPAVYHQIARMPDATVIAEFPFGDFTWELRYVYYSTVHWKRLVNGYSGGFPPGYETRAALLRRVALYPDEAWRALRDIGTTHVIVHEAALPSSEAAAVEKWLDDHFAVEIARFDGGDLLYDLAGAAKHPH
jgi:hypothetical protein